MQLKNATQQAQVDALGELNATNYQRNFTAPLQVCLILMETKRRISLNG